MEFVLCVRIPNHVRDGQGRGLSRRVRRWSRRLHDQTFLSCRVASSGSCAARPAVVAKSALRVGNTKLDEAKAQVRCPGQPIYVRPSERRLLALLMRRCGKVVARQTIKTTGSEFNREISPNAINAQVSRLRKAPTGIGSGIVMETVRGVGYVLRRFKGNERWG
jgi:DNA-binding response OmpR family regulator